MGNYIITLTEDEEKVMAGVCLSTEEWINNVVHDRARRAADHFVTMSGSGSKATPGERKTEIIRAMNIESVADQTARLDFG